ncbi:MAG: hypothetical protein P4M13_02935 [Alphaproteobacteria bacterium]|nr:hypothetical protein [Alphaproteobacteria bacterium]
MKRPDHRSLYLVRTVILWLMVALDFVILSSLPTKQLLSKRLSDSVWKIVVMVNQ